VHYLHRPIGSMSYSMLRRLASRCGMLRHKQAIIRRGTGRHRNATQRIRCEQTL